MQRDDDSPTQGNMYNDANICTNENMYANDNMNYSENMFYQEDENNNRNPKNNREQNERHIRENIEKITCPECYRLNNYYRLDCERCGADLTNEPGHKYYKRNKNKKNRQGNDTRNREDTDVKMASGNSNKESVPKTKNNDDFLKRIKGLCLFILAIYAIAMVITNPVVFVGIIFVVVLIILALAILS